MVHKQSYIPSTSDGLSVVNRGRDIATKPVLDTLHGTFTGVCLVKPCPVHDTKRAK